MEQEYKRKQKGINRRLLEDREMEHEYKRKQKGINNRLLEGREMEALTSNKLSGNMAVKGKTREDSKLTATGKLREIKAGRDYKKRREEDVKIREEFSRSLRSFQPGGAFLLFSFLL